MRAALAGIALATLVATCAQPGTGARAIVETSSGRAVFRVEIADTDELRLRGLMGRESLADDAGMVFLWPEDVESAFHMRDTWIPLSIAFFDADGRIVRILEMVPCAADPCPRYEAGAPYRGALEVRSGALARAGARPGDRVRMER